MTEPGTGSGTGDRAWYRYRIALVVPVPVRNSVPVGSLYTLKYINIHELNFYSVLSINHILHLNYVFDELLFTTYINSFEDHFVDIHDHILNINNYSFLCISMYTY